MSIVSNLYAAKLYSEHPIAIWTLDDDVSYVSLIDDQQRTFEVGPSPYVGWAIDNGTADDALPLPDEGSPFDSAIYAGIAGDTPASNGTIIEAVSPELFLFSDCSQDLETFCISMYVYQPSNYVVEYTFGYKYYDVEPDILCCGKGMGGGVAISGVIGKKDVMDLPEVGNMSSTHSANPLACYAGLAVLDEIKKKI